MENKFEELKLKFPELKFPYYFSTEPGWDTLLEYILASCQKRLEYLKRLLKKYNLDPSLAEVNIGQVKEKFGGLRFYASINYHNDLDNEDEEVRLRFQKDFEEVQNTFYIMISVIESMSYCICEYCGTTQNVTVEGSWVKTLCKDCRHKKENHLEKDDLDWL